MRNVALFLFLFLSFFSCKKDKRNGSNETPLFNPDSCSFWLSGTYHMFNDCDTILKSTALNKTGPYNMYFVGLSPSWIDSLGFMVNCKDRTIHIPEQYVRNSYRKYALGNGYFTDDSIIVKYYWHDSGFANYDTCTARIKR